MAVTLVDYSADQRFPQEPPAAPQTVRVAPSALHRLPTQMQLTIPPSWAIIARVCWQRDLSLAGPSLHTCTAREESNIVAWLVDWWNLVSGTVVRGLGITVVGMALVFFTLGLVILAMVLLTRLPWLRASQSAPETAPAAAQRARADTADAPQEDDLATVAAIAVAVLRSRRRAPLPSRAPAKRSTWRSYGRAHQLGL